MKTSIVIFLFVVMVLLGVGSVKADDPVADPADWPMFMYNAQHTGFNDHSSLTPPLIYRWSYRIFDSVSALEDLAIVDERIYVTHSDTRDWDRYVKCLDARTGQSLWSRSLPPAEMIYPPAAGNGLVYVQVGSGYNSRLYGLSPSTGETEWVVNYREQGGRRFSPTLYEDYLVSTGGTQDQGLFCVNAHTGEPLWNDYGSFYDRVSPAVHENRVYIFSGGYFFAQDLLTGDRLWNRYVYDTLASQIQNVSLSNMDTAPIIDTSRNAAYLMWHQNITAVSLESHDILWQKWANFGQVSCAGLWPGITPAFANDQIFVIDAGHLKSLDCTTGEELWQFTEDSSICFPPVAANGYVYVSGPNNVYAVNIATHQSEFTTSFGHTGRLAIAQDRLYIATQTGNVVCYRTWPTDVEDEPEVPGKFALSQNYPNPFNPSTTISFDLPRRSQVTLAIVNILGQEVAQLVNSEVSAGTHSVEWDGRDISGEVVASGVYLYRLETEDGVLSRKMLLLK